jgi:hypothetical protein
MLTYLFYILLIIICTVIIKLTLLTGRSAMEGMIRKRVACSECFHYSIHTTSSGNLPANICPNCNAPLSVYLDRLDRDTLKCLTTALERNTIQRIHLDRIEHRQLITYFLSLCRYYRVLAGTKQVYIELKRPLIKESTNAPNK